METQNKQNVVTLFVKVAAKAESQVKAKAALLEDVHGAWTESGNLKMELYEAKNQANSFYLFERWQDQASLENHFKQPYTTAAFDLQLNDLTVPIEMNYLVDLWPLKENLKKQEHNALTTLIVTFEVQPGNGEKLVELFENFVPIVGQERGNVEFHFHKVIGNDNLFVLYERWEKQEDLDHHNTQQTTIELVSKVGPLLNGTVLDSILFVDDISEGK